MRGGPDGRVLRDSAPGAAGARRRPRTSLRTRCPAGAGRRSPPTRALRGPMERLRTAVLAHASRTGQMGVAPEEADRFVQAARAQRTASHPGGRRRDEQDPGSPRRRRPASPPRRAVSRFRCAGWSSPFQRPRCRSSVWSSRFPSRLRVALVTAIGAATVWGAVRMRQGVWVGTWLLYRVVSPRAGTVLSGGRWVRAALRFGEEFGDLVALPGGRGGSPPGRAGSSSPPAAATCG